MYGKKCKMKGKPDMSNKDMGGGYPTVKGTAKASMDKSIMAKAQAGGVYETAPSKSGNMVDGTFSKISYDASYTKTPSRS